MKRDGAIKEYAIGGAIAVMFYTEPFFTVGLDIMFIPDDEEKSKIAPLYPIYTYLVEKRRYEIWQEYIIVEGVTCQFIPVGNKLELEAVLNADETAYENVKTRVFKPEYIIAIYVNSDRRKDREKISRLFEQYDINRDLLEDILKRHGLYDRYVENKRWYYD